jgi:hypothetical protein
MPNLYMKLNANIEFSHDPDDESIDEQLGGEPLTGMGLSIYKPDSPSIIFTLSKSNLVAGKMDFSVVNGVHKLECDGVFEVSCKPAYVDDFLSQSTKWIFNKLLADPHETTIYAECKSGVEIEEFTGKNRNGEFKAYRYHLSPVTAKTKKGI